MIKKFNLLPILSIAFLAFGALSAQTASYTPLSPADCKSIQANLEKVINTKFKMTPSKAHSMVEGKLCYLEAKDKEAIINTVSTPGKIDNTMGWEVDGNFAADGPTGTQSGLKKDKKLLIYEIKTGKMNTLGIYIGEKK